MEVLEFCFRCIFPHQSCFASFPGQSDPDIRSKVEKASSPSAGGSLPSNRASDGCGQGLSTRQMNAEVIEVC